MLSHYGRFPSGTVQSMTGCNLMTAVCSPMSQKESSVTFAFVTKGTTGTTINFHYLKFCNF